MARARSGGGGAAYAWALVVFGVGFFLCLILAIVFSTQVSKARQDATAAEDKLEVFVNKAQEASPAVQAIRAEIKGRDTVVQKLLDENSALRTLITGTEDLTTEAIKEQKANKNIQDALLIAIDKSNQQIARLEGLVEAANAERKKAQERAADAEQRLANLDEKYQQAKDQLAATFDSTASTYNTAVTGYGTLRTDLGNEMDRVRSELQDQLTQKDAQLEELRAENARLRSQLQKCMAERTGTTLTDVIPADGRVVSLIPEQNMVYINRGADDYVQLGMTFEVFGKDDLIKLTEYEDLRGKATIEVVSIEANTAVARVVRRERSEKIATNDQIANLVYDASAKFKFYVFGEFDIDNTGETTTRDRDRIKSMISRWGGVNNDELTWDVDFLVLGKEPPVPDPLDPDEIDPTVIRAHADATKVYDTYQRLITEAKTLSIPVLNQNRFLGLVGYYKR